MRPNPLINRNCNSPLRRLLQSGYLQRWASGIAASQSPKGISMFCAPVHQSEYNKLEVPAPKALDTKSWAANRRNPMTGRAVHQTMNLCLMTKLKSKVQTQKHNSVPGSSAVQWCISMALRPNPPINRNCNSPLRGLPQSGYWQR